EFGDCLTIRDRIGRHEVAQFDFGFFSSVLAVRADRRENCSRQRESRKYLLHSLSLSLTICPPRVSRTAPSIGVVRATAPGAASPSFSIPWRCHHPDSRRAPPILRRSRRLERDWQCGFSVPKA